MKMLHAKPAPLTAPNILILLSFISIFPVSVAASLRTDLSIENYANKPQELEARGDLEWYISSEKTVRKNIPRSELHFNFFYETGPYGDRSIDPDIAVWRFGNSSTDSHFWFGRSHPLLEGFPSGEKISPTSAVGTNWLQNQSNALEPNVVGWIGAGIHSKYNSLFFTAAATPIYFPNFGPRTDLSEDADAEGSRFARLPPQYVRLGDGLVPLRFHIDTGDITKIIFQAQALLATGYEGKSSFLRLAAWSSPTLNPQVDTNEVLRIQDNDLNVLVTAKPKFPRENFFAFTYAEKITNLNPIFESVYETRTKRFSISQSIEAFSFLQIGGLHTFYQPEEISSSTPESPKYDKYLLWIELTKNSGSFRPSFRYERHFSKGKEDNWMQMKLRYYANKQFSLFSKLNILTGSNLSYFGTWRSLDSIHMGASYLW